MLAVLGDSVTTDHISPAGSIPAWSPAGQWLQAHGVTPLDFNSYGARRGHHEVMMRGTFGNIRLRNALAEQEGPYTTHQPSGEEMFLYDAVDALRGRGRAAGHPGRQGVRQRLIARLGRQGHRPCWASARCIAESTSASTARTWWAWASCRSSSCPARAPARSA